MSMRKGHSLMGLPVIAQSNGENLGKVLDLIFDHDADECVALVVKERDVFGLVSARVVLWSEVLTIGPDAVMARAPESRIVANQDKRLQRLMERDHHLAGTSIYTTDGQNLGTFGDVFLDPESGRVLGYEVSGGFVSDTMSGKRFLTAEVGPDVGKDTILVPPHTAELLQEQADSEPGGIKGAARVAGDKVSAVYGNISSASVEKQQDWLVGKTAGYDVVLPNSEITSSPPALAPPLDESWHETPQLVAADGSLLATHTHETPLAVSSSPVEYSGEILVRKGETVTREHALRATQADILGTLVSAAIAGGASGQYEVAKEKVSGVAGGYGQNAEEAAIGKASSREVSLSDGATLVAPGQIITREIMDEAKAHGKEKEVIASAGLGVASEKLQSGTQAVKEGAGSLWETVKEKTAHLGDAAHERKAEYDEAALQRRINDALGRPVNRIILAPDDAVILNTGDIITNKAVNTAQDQGVLEILLDSVYHADPDITPEMLRLDGKGEAALENQAEPSGGPLTATLLPDEQAQDETAQGILPTYDGRPPLS